MKWQGREPKKKNYMRLMILDRIAILLFQAVFNLLLSKKKHAGQSQRTQPLQVTKTVLIATKIGPTTYVLRSLRLLKLKTEGQTI